MIVLNEWLNEINNYEIKYEKITPETKMASLKNLMPRELFNKEFRVRRFKDFEDMLDSTKLFLADRPVNQQFIHIHFVALLDRWCCGLGLIHWSVCQKQFG